MKTFNDKEEEWDLIIEKKNSNYFGLNLIWNYRDLLFLFVKRDFISQYKQTILGPLWFFIQPILTTIIFTVIFGNLAQISTDGIPKLLFYISSMTTKYKDLTFLVSFGVQLLMYASPIVYPLSIVEGKFKFIILLNPMTSIIEVFKNGFLGQGEFDFIWLLYSVIISVLIFILGIFIFNKVEKSFIDTV